MLGSKTIVTYLAAFAIVLTLPLLVDGPIATYLYAQSERSRLEGLADNANRTIVALIDHELSTRSAMLQALATARSLQTGEIAGFDEQARELALQTGVQFVLFDTLGQQLVNTRLPQGSPLPRVPLTEIHLDVMHNRRIHVSNVFMGIVNPQQVVHVAVPVIRGDEVIGILTSPVRPQRLVELLRQGLSDGPFYATILDRNGTIVARSVGPASFVGRPFPALAQAAQGSVGTVSLNNAQGVPIFGYFRRPELSGWLIVTAVERAALTGPLTRSLEFLAFAAAGLVAVALFGGWWIGRKLALAHGALLTAAHALARGEVIGPPRTALHEANVVGNALATASVSIARHAEALQRANLELEERVSSRTSELAAKTALLETTLDTMDQGLIVIDRDGRVPVSNPQARDMLDLPDDLMDRRPAVAEVLAFQERRGDFAGLPPTSMRLLDPRPGKLPNVFERQRRDGRVLEVRTVPVPGGGGFISTYTDVSDQHRQAQELEQARDAAERANRAKDDFLATMSHEMRTPLNAVIGYAERLIDDGRLSGDARISAGRIQSAGTALLCLIDDILDIGKIEAGIIDVRTEPFSLTTLIEDAVSIVRPIALGKGLELHASLSVGTGGMFLGDHDRLRQILLNLVNNAIKFTASGAVMLTVVSRAGEEDGQPILHFAVSDTGIGIAKADQADLFRRFHQIDPSVDRRFGGVGLGLAICKQLVERMGGSIGVESDLGRGATFWFKLPLMPAAPADGSTPPDAVSERRELRILVAEDVEFNQELARELLEGAGHKVDVVANGVEALDAVRGASYDMILMDVSMPEMDGLTATRRIRGAGHSGSTTPIVACTANVRAAEVSAFRDAGVDAYLRKPLRSAELHATISRLFALALPQQVQTAQVETDEFQQIVSLLGPKRVIKALDRLADELASFPLSEPASMIEREGLGARAHALISTVSMLGLTELSEACRDITNACRDAGDTRAALRRFDIASKRASTRAAAMRLDLERSIA